MSHRTNRNEVVGLNAHQMASYAHRHRLLQAGALIKLFEQGRLAELPDGSIDPMAVLSPDEVVWILSEA